MTSLATDQSKHVFLSYSRKDGSKLAKRLQTTLATSGFSVWRDEANPVIGAVPFGRIIQQAVDDSFALLAILTPLALASYWTRAEWYYAIAKGITVIPILGPAFDDSMMPLELYPLAARIVIPSSDPEYGEVAATLCALIDSVKAAVTSSALE